MSNNKDCEHQYQNSIKKIISEGNEKLGLMTSWAWQDDPKRLVFTLSRYKFVSKMFNNNMNILEIGCSDCFASRIVRQAVNSLTAIDIDISFINDSMSRKSKKWDINIIKHDIMDKPMNGNYDGVFSMDVLEHIEQKDENVFIMNSIKSLKANGVAIFGMPSLNSQPYASIQSKLGHVNCKHQNDFYKLMKKYFHNVFMFSMNDEVVHTGYHEMSHYHIALCCGKI